MPVNRSCEWKYICFFKGFTNSDLVGSDKVGGKCASLINMTNNTDVPVPSGFAITVDGYQLFLEANPSIRYILDNFDDSCRPVDIRRAIINGDMPEELLTEIERACQLLWSDSAVEVAVRSSSVDEDSLEASFAGQQDTYLHVTLDKLSEYIKKCYASLFNDRAVSYRTSHGKSIQDSLMSVAIQEMICSQVSGVAFSVDPDTNFSNVVIINSSWGLGESVVQGEVTPDEFMVFKPTKSIIGRRLGNKMLKTIRDSSQGTRTVECSLEERTSWTLSDQYVQKLFKMVLALERYYQHPVDVEWALGDDSQLYILQSRPITTLKKSASAGSVYRLTEEPGEPLVTGISVGNKIGCGVARVIKSLEDPSIKEFADGDILVTEMTDPDWEPLMKKASAIVTDKGGRVCHAAIIAREYGIPALVGTDSGSRVITSGMTLTVDCSSGGSGAVYKGEVAFEVIEQDMKQLKELVASLPVKLMLNVGSPDNAFRYAHLPHAGVGLAREEFIINNAIGIHPLALLQPDKVLAEAPDVCQEISRRTGLSWEQREQWPEFFVERLAEGIARIAGAFWPHPVIIRFSDFKSNEYRNLLGGALFEPQEENPMIGWRGASRYYSDVYREAFGLECRAIKRVREQLGLRNVVVMLPFVRTVEECRRVLEVMASFGLVRGQEGLQVYLMCEIPANALLAEDFCQLVDGFSIGSNDMTQLTLGLDRDSHLVAHLYDERNQAVKKMLQMAIRACKKTGTKIGICGQGPSDHADFAQFLMEEGIDSISVVPDSLYKTAKTLGGF